MSTPFFPAFQEAVQNANTVFMTAHVGPDGDTLGSMLALKHAFEKTYPHLRRIDCVIAGKMPDVYHFLPGLASIHNIETSTDLLPEYDLAICLDCGSADRLGPAQGLFTGARQSVNIDHHISNKHFGQLNIVIPTAAASGEVVADLLSSMGIPLDANIATCLYAAILTDTGGFKYGNTTPKIFRLAADLLEAGAPTEMIFKQIYENRPRAQALLLAEALRQTEFNADYTLAWTTVTQEMMARHGAAEEHVEGLVEALRQIDTVVLSAVFRETTEGATKISLRSDNHAISVADVVEPLGGGGHKMAAGCTLHLPPEAAREKLLPLLRESLKKHVSV